MSSRLSLVYALPCEKAIIAKNEQLSLIGLMESVEVGTTKDAPAKFLAPMKWVVASLWKRSEATTDDLSYEQKTILYDLDGDELFTSLHKFNTLPNYQYFRNIVDFPGVPVSQSGPIELVTFLRESTSNEWTKHGSYQIYVNRQTVEEEAPNVTPEPA